MSGGVFILYTRLPKTLFLPESKVFFKLERDDDTEAKEDDVMNAQIMGIERPCTIRESISESFKEIKLMQEGKLPKKTWDMYLRERETKREDFTLR